MLGWVLPPFTGSKIHCQLTMVEPSTLEVSEKMIVAPNGCGDGRFVRYAALTLDPTVTVNGAEVVEQPSALVTVTE